MQRDDTIYLGHMLDMARKVVLRVKSKTKADYHVDEDLRSVIAHLVQTTCEAAARVSTPTRDKHQQIPWKQITGIRHRIVHDYMGVDYHILWVAATRHYSQLIQRLEEIVPSNEHG